MMNATLKAHTNQLKRNVKKIPDFLIREVMDGQPLYYRGYRDVLRKLKTIEDIMPCSTLQATIVLPGRESRGDAGSNPVGVSIFSRIFLIVSCSYCCTYNIL